MDETYTITLTPAMMALVPVVATLLQLAKAVKPLEKIKPYFPFVGIGISYGLCILTGVTSPVMPSILIGLVAAGGYDMLKAKPPVAPTE